MRWRHAAGLLFVASILAGCHGSRPAARSSGILRYPISVEPRTLDPAGLNETPTLEMLQNVYEGLVMLDAENRVIPQLADRWEISPDRLTYTFHLHPGVKFHNGRALTADDFKYSFERALSPDTKSGVAMTYLGGVIGAKDLADGKRKDLPGVKVLDPATLSITIDKPRGYFLGALVYPTGWVVCKEAIESNGGVLDERSTVGTGPFKLVDYRRGSKFILTANPGYWGAKPRLSGIERPIVKEAIVAHIKYEAGEVDLAGIPPEQFQKDQANPVLKNEIHINPQADTYFITMHPRLEPAFKDVRVRRAIMRCIDRDEVIRVAGKGLWPRADSFLPPEIPGSDPNAPKVPYNPAEGRKLLAQAGYPGGKGFPTLIMVYPQSSPTMSAIAQIVRRQLQENLHVHVDLQEREGETLRNQMLHQEVAFTIGDWGADYIDPQNFLSMLLHSKAPMNFFGYSNPKFDSLCDQADSETDLDKRIPLYRQADRVAMDDVALLPLFFVNQRILIKPYIRDWSRNAMSFLPHYKTWIAN